MLSLSIFVHLFALVTSTSSKRSRSDKERKTSDRESSIRMSSSRLQSEMDYKMSGDKSVTLTSSKGRISRLHRGSSDDRPSSSSSKHAKSDKEKEKPNPLVLAALKSSQATDGLVASERKKSTSNSRPNGGKLDLFSSSGEIPQMKRSKVSFHSSTKLDYEMKDRQTTKKHPSGIRERSSLSPKKSSSTRERHGLPPKKKSGSSDRHGLSPANKRCTEKTYHSHSRRSAQLHSKISGISSTVARSPDRTSSLASSSRRKKKVSSNTSLEQSLTIDDDMDFSFGT